MRRLVIVLLALVFLFVGVSGVKADDRCPNYCDGNVYKYDGLFSTFLGEVCYYAEQECEHGCSSSSGCLSGGEEPSSEPSTSTTVTTQTTGTEEKIDEEKVEVAPAASPGIIQKIMKPFVVEPDSDLSPSPSVSPQPSASPYEIGDLLPEAEEVEEGGIDRKKELVEYNKFEENEIGEMDLARGKTYGKTESETRYVLGLIPTEVMVTALYDAETLKYVRSKIPWWARFTSKKPVINLMAKQFGPECKDEVYVNDSAVAEGADGSREKPYASVKEAVESGGGCEELTVRVDRGVYIEGDIEIGGNVRIVGDDFSRVAGSDMNLREQVRLRNTRIVNNGRYRLEIRDLTLEGVGVDPISSVVVNHVDAETRLVDVLVVGGGGQGVRQIGGKITTSGVVVMGMVERGDGELDDGTGMYLGGGAEAELINLSLMENGDGGLRITDSGTRVYARDLYAEGNMSKGGEGILGKGAVEVRNQALLLLENATIRDSDMVGLAVLDSGGVHMRGGGVYDATVEFREDGGSSGGINIGIFQKNEEIVSGGARMEMTDVVSVNAGRVGVMLQDGEMKINSGRSTDTEFGFFWTKHLMESADFKYGCVVNLEFENVDHGFYAGGLNLIIDDRVRTAPDLSKNPSPRPSIDPLRSCIQVPFDCSWCGD